jgi:integrase
MIIWALHDLAARHSPPSAAFSHRRLHRIPAEAEKGRKDRLYPVAPQFAELLLATPESVQTGFVFNPVPTRVIRGKRRAGRHTAGRTVSRIGEAAGIVVDRKGESVSYATAHDLRRSFGLRWSRRVMPPVLKELMRHSSIDTTMKFYISQNAEATAAELYAAIGRNEAEKSVFGNTPGNTTPNSSGVMQSEVPVTD